MFGKKKAGRSDVRRWHPARTAAALNRQTPVGDIASAALGPIGYAVVNAGIFVYECLGRTKSRRTVEMTDRRGHKAAMQIGRHLLLIAVLFRSLLLEQGDIGGNLGEPATSTSRRRTTLDSKATTAPCAS